MVPRSQGLVKLSKVSTKKISKVYRGHEKKRNMHQDTAMGIDSDNGVTPAEVEEQGLKGDRIPQCCSVCSRR